MGCDGWPPGGVEASPWFHQRIVLVNGRLDDALATRAVAALLNLSASGDAPIELHVDSPEGTLEGAFALIDALGMIRAPVRTLCRGLVGTPAIGVVAATGHRVAVSHARFRLTQPTVRLFGTADKIEAGRRAHRDLLVRFQAHLARAAGRPVDDIADAMRRSRDLDAREAIDYGLIDVIRDSVR